MALVWGAGGFKGKGTGEQALLRGLLDNFKVGDVDALFEQHGSRRRSTDFRRGKKLGSRDHLITFEKPKVRPQWMTTEQYQTAPDTLVVRELEVGGRVLVTTLLCPNITPKNALKELYKRRWQVELDIRNLKTTLSCKTPEMGEKEMWVYLLAYNLIRLIMAQSALLADVRSLST